jgi:hypothetical protein
MSDIPFFSLPPLPALRRAGQAIGAIGALWGIVPLLVALEVLGEGNVLSLGDGRSGWGIGLGLLAAWLCGVAGVALIGRYTALAATLLFVAACAGFLLVGAPWIGPGTLLAVSSWLTLLGTENPFEAEMQRERSEERARSDTSAA